MRHNKRYALLTIQGFNSRTREGCDGFCSALRSFSSGFNSRTREGCDAIDEILRAYGIVSIHAPARGATRLTSLSRQVSCFNSRTREGCDHQVARGKKRAYQGFNSRTREGCDKTRIFWDWVVSVSIHAPARGATLGIKIDCTNCLVSIHAPARGATNEHRREKRIFGFNSRTREGCDAVPNNPINHQQVSIHAPARGATAGSRAVRAYTEFQFTHPRGVRQY